MRNLIALVILALIYVALIAVSTQKANAAVQVGPYTFEGESLSDTQLEAVGHLVNYTDFDWSRFEEPIRVNVVSSGGTFAGRWITINRLAWTGEAFAKALLHETGHVYDSRYLGQANQLEINPAGNWPGIGLDYAVRPIEMWARGFADAYYPGGAGFAGGMWFPSYSTEVVREYVGTPFKDIADLPRASRHAIYVLWREGITKGTSATTYDPHAPVPTWQYSLFASRTFEVSGWIVGIPPVGTTREQMALTICRSLES